MALRFGQVVLACSALAVPFVLVASCAAAFVEPLSRAAVSVLLSASSALAPASVPSLPPEPLELDEEPLPSEAITTAISRPKAAGARAAKATRPQPPAALFVSAATVLRLSRGSVRPQGAFVLATAQHPAGLRLSGVAALGIGVQDGDILVEAMGAAPRSPGQIIGAIIEARAGQARYLSGTLWRRGQTVRITVEQPYLEPAGESRWGRGPTDTKTEERPYLGPVLPEPTAALATP